MASMLLQPRINHIGFVSNRPWQGAKLIGCGSSLPKQILHNKEFHNSSDEWIRSRTGIQTRHIISGHETMTKMAVEASKKALEMSNMDPEEVDMILLCTSTPDNLLGSAPAVANELGCKNVVAFDTTAACSGFVIGIITASLYIKGGAYRTALVIGADTLSRYVNWNDRNTCILFGDAAGAVVLQATNINEDGILGFHIETNPAGLKHLTIPVNQTGEEVGPGPLKKPVYDFLHMNGREVYQLAIQTVPRVLTSGLHNAGVEIKDIDWLLLHQANQRIVDRVTEELQVPKEKALLNIAKYGNTSAASIALALDEAVRSNKVKPGHVIASVGFGAGFTCASAILKWI